MASEHPKRAALAAAVIPTAAIAVFGNRWFTEEVRIKADGPLERRLVNIVGGPFQWTFTPRSGRDADTIWLSQVVGIVAVIGLTFLITWLVARSASKFGLLVATLGATVLATMVAYAALLFLTYDAFYGGRDVEPGINQFWYAVLHSTDPGLWAAGVGVVAGLAALLLSGGTRRAVIVEERTWQQAGPPPDHTDVRPGDSPDPSTAVPVSTSTSATTDAPPSPYAAPTPFERPSATPSPAPPPPPPPPDTTP